MKRIVILFAVILCIFGIHPASVLAAEADIIANDETGIPDKGLYQAILQEIGKP